MNTPSAPTEPITTTIVVTTATPPQFSACECGHKFKATNLCVTATLAAIAVRASSASSTAVRTRSSDGTTTAAVGTGSVGTA